MDKDKLRQFIADSQKAGLAPQEIDRLIQKNSTKFSPQLPSIPQSVSILPKQFPITQEVGNYNPTLYAGINKSMTNTGLDIGAPTGTPLNLPIGQWQVEEVGGGYNRGYGTSTVVKNTKTGEKLRFSHLSEIYDIKPGQVLEGGGTFGKVGQTGHATGSHLDLEMYDPQGKLTDITKTPFASVLFPK